MTRKAYSPIVKLAHPDISGQPLATRCEMLWIRDQASMALRELPCLEAQESYRAAIYIVTEYWAKPLTDDELRSFYRGAKIMFDAAVEMDKLHRG